MGLNANRKDTEMNKALSRREFLKAAGVGAAALAMPASLLGAEAGRKPNVLFIPVDDLRPELGCYGREQIHSPNIDRLASRGVMFRRSYCQYPVCGASRASLLSGLRPTRTRFTNYMSWVEKDARSIISLPQTFKDNGYHTVSNGKVFHHQTDSEKVWSERPWRARPCFAVWRTKAAQAIIKSHKHRRGPACEAADVPDDGYPDGVNANKAIADLRRLKKMDKPFFLSAGFEKPHLPFNAPKKYWDLYERKDINLADNPFSPKDAPSVAVHNSGELRSYAGIPKTGPLSDDLARKLIHGHYACISYVDAQIGKVLDELDCLGLRDNTVVVLWGDHGYLLGEHGMWGKSCNFEPALHSPLIVSAPGITGGKKTDALSEFVDIYPSLCELCDLPAPGHLEGTSFVPLMKKPDRPWKTAAFSWSGNGSSISMRTDRYRYSQWSDKDGKVDARMLYDHKTDPNENVNVANQPGSAELVDKLSSMLAAGFKAARP